MRHVIFILVIVATTASFAQTATVKSTAPQAAIAGHSSSLHMTVMDVFNTAGGIIITGQIDSGSMTNSGTLCLNSSKAGDIEISVLALSVKSRLVETANEGDIFGVKVSGVAKGDVSKGDTIAKYCD